MPTKKNDRAAQVSEEAFAEWKAAAQAHANDLGVVGGDDLWDEDDSYDLKALARGAFERGEDAMTFIEEAFAEDLARAEHDDQQQAESAAYGDEEFE